MGSQPPISVAFTAFGPRGNQPPVPVIVQGQSGGSGAGYQSLVAFGATPDGDDLNNPTDNYDAIITALNSGGMWTGEGKVFAVSGSIMPLLLGTTALQAFVDTTFVQLNLEDSFTRTLYFYRMIKQFYLRNIYVRRHKDNVDATRFGYPERTAAIRIEECDDVWLERCKIEGDGMGAPLHVIDCHGVNHVNTIVRNGHYYIPNDTGLEYLQGAIHTGCTKIRTWNIEAGNFTASIGDVQGGQALPYETDGWDHMRGCRDVVNFGAWLYNVNEGTDNTNNVHSKAEDIKWISSYGENCAGLAFKTIYNSRGGALINCTAKNCGITGAAALGTADDFKSVQDFTIDNFTAMMNGTIPFPRFYPAPAYVTGINLSGAPYVGKGTIVNRPRVYGMPEDCVYGYFMVVRPMNFMTYLGRAYQAKIDDWAENTFYPAGMVKSYYHWFYTCNKDHTSSTKANGGFRQDERNGLWKPYAKTAAANAYLDIPPVWGTYIAAITLTAGGINYKYPRLVFSEPDTIVTDIPGWDKLKATGHADVDSNGTLLNAILDGCGKGYTNLSIASCTVTDGVPDGVLTLTAPGINYKHPSFIFGPPVVGGANAYGDAQVDASGSIIESTIVIRGRGNYTSMPSCQVGDGVDDITVDAGGDLYFRPAVVIGPPDIPGGVQAIAVPVRADVNAPPSPIIDILVTRTGSGYLTKPSAYITERGSGPWTGTTTVGSNRIDNLSINPQTFGIYPGQHIEGPGIPRSAGAVVTSRTAAQIAISVNCDSSAGTGTFNCGGSGATCHVTNNMGTGAAVTVSGTMGSGATVAVTALSPDTRLAARDSANIMWTFMGPDTQCQTFDSSLTISAVKNPGDLLVVDLMDRGWTTIQIGGQFNLAQSALVYSPNTSVPVAGASLIAQGPGKPALWTGGASGPVSIKGAILYPRSNLVLPAAWNYAAFTGNMTSGSAIIDNLSINPITLGFQVGQPFGGPLTGGIPSGTTVSFITATTITISQPATVTAVNANFRVNGLSNLVLPATPSVRLLFAAGVTPGPFSIDSFVGLGDGDWRTIAMDAPQVCTIVDLSRVVDIPPISTTNNKIWAGKGDGTNLVVNPAQRKFKFGLQYDGAMSAWTIDWDRRY